MTDKEPWDSERWKDLPQDIELNAGAGTLVLVCVTAEWHLLPCVPFTERLARD